MLCTLSAIIINMQGKVCIITMVGGFPLPGVGVRKRHARNGIRNSITTEGPSPGLAHRPVGVATLSLSPLSASIFSPSACLDVKHWAAGQLVHGHEQGFFFSPAPSVRWYSYRVIVGELMFPLFSVSPPLAIYECDYAFLLLFSSVGS
jgi:hypothetical protein